MKKQVKGRSRRPVRSSAAKRPSHPPRPSRPSAVGAGIKGKSEPGQRKSVTVIQASPTRPAVAPKSPELDRQQQTYEEAMRLFHAKKFDRAAALFEKATEGPNRTLAHHAQVHSQICKKRLRPPEVELKTVEDHYNYAITMINARHLKEAAQHLDLALRMAPQADHLYYALAAAEALQGNPQAAYEKLKKAIDLQPRNRILARGDADFAGILGYPPLASLLQIDRGWSPKTP